MLYSNFPLVSYFTCGSGYVSVLLSQFVPPSPSPAEFTSPSSTSVYLFLPFKCSPVPFFKFHMHALIHYICFSLSDLLHSVSQVLGSSTSVILTCICFFSWWSNIPLFMCSTTSLSTVLLMDIRLLHALGILNSAAMNIGVHVSF